MVKQSDATVKVVNIVLDEVRDQAFILVCRTERDHLPHRRTPLLQRRPDGGPVLQPCCAGYFAPSLLMAAISSLPMRASIAFCTGSRTRRHSDCSLTLRV